MTDNSNSKNNSEELIDDNNIETAQNESEDVIIDDNSEPSDELEVKDPEDIIEDLNNQLKEEKEKYLRSLADMDNLRKRCRRDMEDARLNGRISVLSEMLPALDSIDMALKSIEPTEATQAVYDGLVMVKKQFLTPMERFELKVVEAKGAIFDPSVHEAVSYIPSMEVDANLIIDEMRTGYTLGERLLRPSMVVVSSGKPPEAAKIEDEDEDPDENPDNGSEDLEANSSEDTDTMEGTSDGQ
ncbi:MAG: nucleotide exchange factor GrpE [Deltaproteobacteria bacterium]|nr:nucleotide exchange factor GrpE [Deltaproteobacteria bacterium]